MARKNKSIISLGIIFAVLVILDLWSTLRFGDMIVYLEANPVYKHIGLTGIIGLNILFLLGMYYWYKKSKSVHSRFYIIHVFILMNFTRIFVIWNNLLAYKEFSSVPREVAVAAAKAVTQEMKTQQILQIALMQFAPLIIGLVTYWFFCIDHEVKFKDVV